jgi:hypothetical protein
MPAMRAMRFCRGFSCGWTRKAASVPASRVILHAELFLGNGSAHRHAQWKKSLRRHARPVSGLRVSTQIACTRDDLPGRLSLRPVVPPLRANPSPLRGQCVNVTRFPFNPAASSVRGKAPCTAILYGKALAVKCINALRQHEKKARMRSLAPILVGTTAPLKNLKLQHWRGPQAKNVPNAAPVLEFCFYISVSPTARA